MIPSKPLDLPSNVARGFMKDLRAYHAEPAMCRRRRRARSDAERLAPCVLLSMKETLAQIRAEGERPFTAGIVLLRR